MPLKKAPTQQNIISQSGKASQPWHLWFSSILREVNKNAKDISGLILSGDVSTTYETTSKNLNGWDYSLNYTLGVLSSIVYTDGSNAITKTLNYTSGALTSVVLSGDTPDGIDLTKSLVYAGDDLIGVSYS